MKQILFLLFTVLLFFQSSFSQTLLKGKVICDASNLGQIYVTNLTTNVKTITDSSGLFSIEAKPSQVLVFSGLKIERKVFNLKSIDFSIDLLSVKVYPNVTQLEEVVIKNYPQITAASLGIVSKNVKTYTPAERKLIAESSGIGFMQLINAINGRTKELKKNVEVEKKEKLLDKLSTLFEEEFYTKTLKIPSKYIKGFQIFAIDDKRLVASLNKNESKLIPLLLTELSSTYNDLFRNDKK
ncbi:hypothetical protein [Flavobacterium sp.]|uniref:hypothetical protein n=1 Tax=Flavobacterium sp. TaxID=239 RepID=UPI0037507B77